MRVTKSGEVIENKGEKVRIRTLDSERYGPAETSKTKNEERSLDCARSRSVIRCANDAADRRVSAKHFDFDEGGALGDEVEGLGGGVGEVENSVVGCGKAVVDGDADGFAIAEVGDAKFCAAAECGVGGGEFGGGIDAAAGGFVSFERCAVEGGVAAFSGMLLRPSRGLRRFAGNGRLSGGRFLQW